MKFLVAVDGSPQSRLACQFVSTLDLAEDDEVIVATVVTRPVVLGAWSFPRVESTWRALDEVWQIAKREATSIVAEAAGAFEGMPCRVTSLIRKGHPLECLARLAAETKADVVVVGPHGRARLPALLLGSVTHGLLQCMPTSVLVVRRPAQAPRRILLATDGSLSGTAATDLLGRLPLPQNPEILVVTCVERWWACHEADTGITAGLRRQAEVVLDDAVNMLRARGRTAEARVRTGAVKEEILAAAEEFAADLVVLGSRGSGGFRGLLLGSVARAVSKAARQSTLVVPAATSKDGG